MSNIKNDTTLFRFISLRAPELTTETGPTRRFVFHPDGETGPFFDAMDGWTEGQSKWEILKTTASTFTTIADEKALQAFVGTDRYTLAGWLANHRTSFEAEALLASISSISALDPGDELMLWDNLFYEVVTQRNYYFKDKVIQILVLNHLIVAINAESDLEVKKAILPILAAAKVVLPNVLFDQLPLVTETGGGDGLEVTPIPRGETPDDRIKELLEETTQNIENLNSAREEVSRLERKYFKDYQQKYQDAVNKYARDNKSIIDTYSDAWATAKRAMCGTIEPPGSEDFCAQPDVDAPDLPAFEFEFKQRVELAELTEDLSETALHTLNIFNLLEDIESYSDIIENIDVQIKKEYKIISDNTSFSTPVLFIGGIPFAGSDIKFAPNGPKPPIDTIPKKFGVKAIGIADYKKVVAHVCCYDAGEVAHIENIMARELRSKTTTRETLEETTITNTTEQEKENLTDNTTTERFQMQSEVAKLLQEQREFTASANFHAGWNLGGSYSLDLGTGYSTASSKEESNRQAVTQSKDLTQRAMERIVTKVRKETVIKTSEKFTEENVHEFDNREGSEHVSGVYRYINAIYKNQIYNYGKRMMYEFMIPEPAKMHKFGMVESVPSSSANTNIIQKPQDPKSIGLLSAENISEYNYKTWAAAYGAVVKPLPAHEIFVGKSFVYNNNNVPTSNTQGGDINIPEDYLSSSAQVVFTGMDGWAGWDRKVIASIGNQAVISAPGRIEGTIFFPVRAFKGSIPAAISSTSYFTCTVTITVGCTLTAEAISRWQEETYDAIIKAYEDKLAIYNNSVSDVQGAVLGTNPGFYRETEQTVLRKNCIAYLMDPLLMGQQFYTGSNLKDFAIPQTQALENYTSLAKFMEQAFEWNLISYNFYPYYWGYKEDWTDMYQYDCNDPLFRSFMQAGMARVVVTVKPGFESAVMHYMATGQIWNGGEIPIIGDPLYLSIVEELAEQEYVVEESWETVVPTNLVALQKGGVGVDANGLPCGDECKDHGGRDLVENNNKLGLGSVIEA